MSRRSKAQDRAAWAATHVGPQVKECEHHKLVPATPGSDVEVCRDCGRRRLVGCKHPSASQVAIIDGADLFQCANPDCLAVIAQPTDVTEVTD